MKLHYYDPMFYIASEEMPFTIRIEATLKENINGTQLSDAVYKASKRYPYFFTKVIEENGELLAVPNEKPPVVYCGPQILPLGGEEVNGHLAAVSYHENIINFFASHIITDGGGFVPFIKTVLYCYLCVHHNIKLDPTGIRLPDEPLFDDELTNPYPEEKMLSAVPLYEKPKREFFRLRDGGYVTDSKATAFRFSVSEDEIMRFNHDNDGSPCVLISSLMTKAIWTVHPDEMKNIVSAVSFNLRPGLGSLHSYRMLCSSIDICYPNRMRDMEISKVCTCSRGTVTLQSQPENVIFYAKQMKSRLEQLISIPDLQTKKRILGKEALEDSVNNTFSVSYVGKVGFGSIEPYLESMYNFTDGSTYQTVFIEVSAINGKFDIAFIQGFSSDIYYRAFLKQLEMNELSYKEDGAVPLNTPKIILP